LSFLVADSIKDLPAIRLLPFPNPVLTPMKEPVLLSDFLSKRPDSAQHRKTSPDETKRSDISFPLLCHFASTFSPLTCELVGLIILNNLNLTEYVDPLALLVDLHRRLKQPGAVEHLSVKAIKSIPGSGRSTPCDFRSQTRQSRGTASLEFSLFCSFYQLIHPASHFDRGELISAFCWVEHEYRGTMIKESRSQL
jgi:hypothetical protein